MGNEQSHEQPDAAHEAHKATFIADLERMKAVEKAKAEKKYAGKKLDRKAWRAIQRAKADESDELEPGEVLSQESEPESLPIRFLGSSQETPTANDLLLSFNPRKDPLNTPSRGDEAVTSDQLLGFGNASASQETEPAPKRLPKLDTRTSIAADTGSPPSADPSKSAARPSNPTVSTATSNKLNSGKAPDSTPTTSNTPASAQGSSAISLSAKRPSTVKAYANERRSSISGLPKIPKRTSVASPQSPDRSAAGDKRSPDDTERPPKWYRDTPNPTTRRRGDSRADTLLQSLRTQIAKCRKPGFGTDPARQKIFREIRDKLHKIVFLEVTEFVLKANRMLHDEDGLPQLFDTNFSGGVVWPFDIRADAEEVYNKVRCFSHDYHNECANLGS